MDNNNFEEIPAIIDETLFETILADHPDKMPSPDEIFAEKILLRESALEKLSKLGLTEEEAKAVIGL